MKAQPNEEQIDDIDFLLILGELFTLVGYGQLIIENARILDVSDALLDQIFDFMVRDFSKFALQLYSKTSSTQVQMDLAMKMLRKPVADRGRFEKVLSEAYALEGEYTWSE